MKKDANFKNLDKITKLLLLVKRVLFAHLNMRIGSSGFTGKIHITINCNAGGIGNTSVQVSQDFNEKNIDAMI
ncbi:hypothetical protein DRH27_03280 [Candidatus Falkowbacteria bacterium]|nr:MAG: hypothetical protein DRH27_03280 [Candidatus Falkowbacteria bacterium]